jgi:hypothetical protein
MTSSPKENVEKEEILSDDVMKSPHRKRRNLSQRKKDRLNEGMKIWTAFYRLIFSLFY